MARLEKNPPPKKLCVGSAASTTGFSFPDDLIQDILLYLPVKSLLRLRTVSKTWLSLISTPNFVDSHLRRSETQETVIGHLDSVTCNKILLLHRQLVIDLELPYSKGDFHFPILPNLKLVGSCNGIICVVVTNCSHKPMSHFSCRKYNNHKIYLWNPATKHSKLISPHSIKRKRNLSNVSYGFGLDSITNDFKVVRTVVFEGEPTRTEVYSANKNVWREIEFEDRWTPDYSSVFDALVKGVLCSIWSGGVLRFDLNKEVFNYDITFPPSIWKDTMYEEKRVIEYKDSIAVVIFDENLISEIDLWKLDDACLGSGSKGTWTLIFSFSLALQLEWVHGYLNSGHFLVKDSEYIWFLCDVNKKVMKKVPVEFDVCETFKYIESLVSIRGSKQVKWNDIEDDN